MFNSMEKVKEMFFRYWKKMKETEFVKNPVFSYFIYFMVSVLVIITFMPESKSNDYLNPLTLTFKNPKTVQMLNMIILYHYVMSFLVAIMMFTFMFIMLSMFSSYPFFYIKPKSKFILFMENEYLMWLIIMKDYMKDYMLTKKSESMSFYMKDMKQSMKDQVTHAPLLEFLWVVFPAIILIFIAYPSVMMLYYNEMFVTPLYNITALGNQWYWTYEYNDFDLHMLVKRMFSVIDQSLFALDLQEGTANMLDLIYLLKKNFSGHQKLHDLDYIKIFKELPEKLLVDSNLIEAKDPKFLSLLSTDQCLVIPSKTPISILVTSADVIHSWAMPSYGVKMDAVPGSMNQQLLNMPLTGTSWGQCSELCGVNHAFMPMEVKVLSFGDFLFYMELKLKEVLFPFILNFYKARLNMLMNFVNYLRENMDNSNLNNIVQNKEILMSMLNSDKMMSHITEKQ